MNTDSLIQRKQLAGRKYNVGFFPFPSLSFYFTVTYTFGIVARKTASSWIVIVCCCVFLIVRKTLEF